MTQLSADSSSEMDPRNRKSNLANRPNARSVTRSPGRPAQDRGNITANALKAQAYQFDLAHRMNAVTGQESYLYDGHGRRARSMNLQTGTIEYYGYGKDGRLLQDWSNRRQVRNGYVYLGNTVVGLYEVNLTNGTVTPKYQHTDALGSPVVTTNASKTVLSRMSYTPYGLPTLPMDGVGYTGHFMDVGTGLTYMQQRYYDPQMGRFLATDPAASDHNLYAYAALNPLSLIDPDGRVVSNPFRSFMTCDLETCLQPEKLTIAFADPGPTATSAPVKVGDASGTISSNGNITGAILDYFSATAGPNGLSSSVGNDQIKITWNDKGGVQVTGHAGPGTIKLGGRIGEGLSTLGYDLGGSSVILTRKGNDIVEFKAILGVKKNVLGMSLSIPVATATGRVNVNPLRAANSAIPQIRATQARKRAIIEANQQGNAYP